MAGYGEADSPKKTLSQVDLSETAIDEIIEKMENGEGKMDELQGKVVKLRNAEVQLLKQFEGARDYMMEMLQRPDEGRETLQKIFGGDCVRIARIRTVLDAAKFSDMYENDQRISDGKSACESVEKVLEDLGLGAALRQALQDQKIAMRTRKSTMLDPEQLRALIAQQQAADTEETPVLEAPVIEEEKQPEPKKEAKRKAKSKPKKKDLASEALARTIDESLVERILACTTCAELAEIEEPSRSQLGNWMIWMVHRAHLDDPTLSKFDFTNLHMPPASEEPRISPKLVKAIAANTHIEHLLLPNTNIQAAQGAVLAESIAANSSIKVLNVDSNFLGQTEMESLANACGVNQTLEEVRVNNQHGLMMGRSTFEGFNNAVKANKMICKLGLAISDPHHRGEIDKSIMRNNDDARKRRVAAKKAAEEA